MEKNIKIDYLRFSLTDKCNLNCIYCNPLQKDKFVPREKILTHEEIAKIVKLFVKKGIKKLRLTGGEPLIKRDLIRLVNMFKEIKDLKEISITTNGTYLKDFAASLKTSGIDRINISLDTLKKDKYKNITGSDCFENVWAGIENSLKYGLNPVKLNVVLMKGINDDEIKDFAQLTKDYNLAVRFIELYPTNMRVINFMSHQMKNQETKEIIKDHFGELKLIPTVKGNGPAEYYRLRKAKGTIGFINNLSDYFCHSCNRIRINCAGMIAPCLFSGYIYDIKPLLRKENQDNKLLTFIENIIKEKPKYKKDKTKICNIEMSSVGG